MIKQVDFLEVKHRDIPVGRLVLNKENIALFEYDKSWLSSGFSISPIVLPLAPKTFKSKQNPFNGLFGVFNDSLPDGWGKLLIDRYMRKKGFDPHDLTVLDRLSLVGKNGMGALSYVPENEISAEDDNEDINFYAKAVEKILNSENTDNLELFIAKNGSSAGVRPKIIIEHEGEAWLGKFPSMFDEKTIGEIEYKTSLLAKQCKIEMAETKLFHGKYFGTKLFDRSQHQRFHVHTASGLLYASHRIPSLDYEDLLKLTHLITKDIEEVEKMYNLMVFNVLIGNRDDHAKNFSFIYKENTWKLAPAYDLTPSYGFNGNHSTTILGKGNPDKQDMLDLAKKFGFSQKKAKTIIQSNTGIISDS